MSDQPLSATSSLGPGSGDTSAPEAQHWTPPASRMRPIIAFLVGLALFVAVLAIWQLPPFGQSAPRTDNAYVRGQTTSIAPEASGRVEQVLVGDYERVRKGQLLLRIEADSYVARLDQARAELAARESDLANNRQRQAAARASLTARRAMLAGVFAQRTRAAEDLRRARALVTDGSVSQRETDAALAAYRSADASVRQAEADIGVAQQAVRTEEVAAEGLRARVLQTRALVRSAMIDLEHTRVVAPADGRLGPVDTHVGRFVASGTPIFALVPPERWVLAEYKEAQTRDLRVGQSATFKVDALGGAAFRGTVERIAPATGSEFALIRPQNGTGNFVKVPQRIGIRVAIDAGQRELDRLIPGMSVELAIDTSKRRPE